MGRRIDMDQRLSAEDKQYLLDRGRGYLIPANERRFGTADEPHDPEEHELSGQTPTNQFYDADARNLATYDQGGAPLPGSVLSYDTGRTYDRENGVELQEPRFGTPQPGQFANKASFDQDGWAGRNEDGGDIDEDIADHITGLSPEELEAEAKENGIDIEKPASVSTLNVDELRENLVRAEVSVPEDVKKAELAKLLRERLAKDYVERLQDALAVHLQDARDREAVSQAG